MKKKKRMNFLPTSKQSSGWKSHLKLYDVLKQDYLASRRVCQLKEEFSHAYDDTSFILFAHM